MFKHKNTGFTLIEVMVVVSIILIVLGVTLFSYRSFQGKTDVDSARNTVVNALRKAQSNSQAILEDDDWGVYVETGSVVIFKGADYTTRDTSFDEQQELGSRISPASNYEIIFTKFSGESSFAGDILLNGPSVSRTISVNEKGTLGY